MIINRNGDEYRFWHGLIGFLHAREVCTIHWFKSPGQEKIFQLSNYFLLTLMNTLTFTLPFTFTTIWYVYETSEK